MNERPGFNSGVFEAQERQFSINEFPYQEIYCKLSFPEGLSIGEMMASLLNSPQLSKSEFVPLMDKVDIFHHIVMKFHTTDGSITLTYHPDGSWRFKQKGRKQYLGKHILYRDETKLLIPSSENIYDFTNLRLSQPLTPQNHSGMYLRIKHQFDVWLRGRVYKVNGDLIRPIDGFSLNVLDVVEECNQEHGPKMHQIEVKYRGIADQSASKKPSREDIARDILLLRRLVCEVAKQQNVDVKSTKKSKNKWLRENKK
jgi:hypothetical protein